MTLQEIKKAFYTFRNGIISDTLRKHGDSHRMIFGLNLPQIVEIANSIGVNKAMAETLWADSHVRESQLLATHIFPIAEFDKDIALRWINDALDEEIADMLCFKLLRKAEYANDLCFELIDNDNVMKRYIGYRLALNLLVSGKMHDKNTLKALLPNETANLSNSFKLLLNNIQSELEN